jgi:2-iminobutanoate/2-iminopropanoate deaminase
VKAGRLVFVSGQLPLAMSGEIVSGGIEEQTEQALKNLSSVLSAAGLALDAVVKTTVFLADLEDFQAMNGVYARHFNESPPARACVSVSRLPRGARVEIEAVALAR